MNYKSIVRRTIKLVACGLLSALPLAISAEPWPEKYFNPKPLADDVILPLPCEGAMVFRKVMASFDDPLKDYPIQIGQENAEWGYVEQTRPAFISGSFTATGEATGQRYYLMAKYELSQLQYLALQQPDQCPKPPKLSKKLQLPQTGISWFEAISLSNRYNVWLRRQAPKSIPQEDGVPGFVRLPTEVEWEFAARGGLSVGAAEFRESTYPMPKGGLPDYEWFAGNRSANGKLQLTGLLEPNPLGLHDILGNAAEMMFEPFHLNKLDRLHGQAGGFVVRGDSYLVPQAEFRTAARREVSYYNQEDEYRDPTIGIRLVMVSPILTSRDRVAVINSSWQQLGSDQGGKDPQRPDTVKGLTDLATSVQDKALQNKLRILEQQLRVSNQENENARDESIRANLNLGAFLCTKIKDDGLFVDLLQKNYDINCAQPNEDDAKICASRQAKLAAQQDRLQNLGNYYANTMASARRIYSHMQIKNQVPVLTQMLRENKQIQGLEPYLQAYWKHADHYLKTERRDDARWFDDCKAVQPVS